MINLDICWKIGNKGMFLAYLITQSFQWHCIHYNYVIIITLHISWKIDNKIMILVYLII